jgi:hypothetical protein
MAFLGTKTDIFANREKLFPTSLTVPLACPFLKVLVLALVRAEPTLCCPSRNPYHISSRKGLATFITDAVLLYKLTLAFMGAEYGACIMRAEILDIRSVVKGSATDGTNCLLCTERAAFPHVPANDVSLVAACIGTGRAIYGFRGYTLKRFFTNGTYQFHSIFSPFLATIIARMLGTDGKLGLPCPVFDIPRDFVIT